MSGSFTTFLGSQLCTLQLFRILEREGKAMQIVNSHCGSLMQKYTQCVQKFPKMWDYACSHQRHELARCSETHPTMVKVKMKCNSAYESYQTCYKRYPRDNFLCSMPFNTFLNCVEDVANEPPNS